MVNLITVTLCVLTTGHRIYISKFLVPSRLQWFPRR